MSESESKINCYWYERRCVMLLKCMISLPDTTVLHLGGSQVAHSY